MFVCSALHQLLRGLLVPRLLLVTETLALRQQLLVLQRATNQPALRRRDRLFWVALFASVARLGSILVIVRQTKASSLGQGTGMRARRKPMQQY